MAETTIPGIAGLGTGKAQHYFASDFDRLSHRLLDASEIATVEVVTGSVQRYCTRSARTAMQYWT
jgi:hypothetical protein